MSARPKRKDTGVVMVNDEQYGWQVYREPQWCATDGWQGLALLVKHCDGQRETILQYPARGPGVPVRSQYRSTQLQRPKISANLLDHGLVAAIEGGWDPLSRGKMVTIDTAYPSPR